jgi:hypothetical protein
LAAMVSNPNYPSSHSISAIRNYMALLREIVSEDKNRKQELRIAVGRIKMSSLRQIDATLEREFGRFYNSELAAQTSS